MEDRTQGPLTIALPDDFHAHLRDGALLQAVLPFTAAQFPRALVMPNTDPPIRTAADAVAYRDRILAALPPGTNFTPLMTLYLTDETTPQDIIAAHETTFVRAAKLYPAGATTHSTYGVRRIENLRPALSEMARRGMVLCIHGEVTDPSVDIFDREMAFVKTKLPLIQSAHPTLKIVLEHITTAAAAEAVVTAPRGTLAATLTPHHLLHSRNSLFEGAKLRPDFYCLPILKKETERQALLAAIREDEEGRFFAGTDSAPHTRDKKECDAGCAGIFNAPAAVELYAEAFEEAGALHRLGPFLSENGAKFYGLEKNGGIGLLRKIPRKVAAEIPVVDNEPVRPLRGGQTVSWSFSRG